MKPDTIHQTLFGTPWQRCHIQLSSGETLTLEHPDWALMSQRRTFLIVVLADPARAHDSYRVIEPHHIASFELERQTSPQPKLAETPRP